MGALLSTQKDQREQFKTDQVIGIKNAPPALTETWSWGRNGDGQLGTSDRTDYITPIHLSAVSAKGVIGNWSKYNECSLVKCM